MQFSTARSERITAIVSTLVAVAILAGGVTAYQSHHAPVDDVVQLESDFRFQLEVGFRHDVNERTLRLVQLEKVLQAWQQSMRTTADHEQLASWLLEATIRSMPGSIETLPAVPRFGVQSRQPVAPQSPDVLVEPSDDAGDMESVTQVPTSAVSLSAIPTPASPLSTEISPRMTTSARSLATSQPAFMTAPVEALPVRINLTELAARIAGYHEGLDEIESALLTLAAKDFTALGKQIRLLEEIAQDFHFVKLYYEALTDQERRAVASPRSMATTIAEIERRIDRTQEALSGDYLGEFDASNRDRIGKLRQLVADITATTR